MDALTKRLIERMGAIDKRLSAQETAEFITTAATIDSLNIHDGTGGIKFWTTSGLTTTPATIIADGTEDVTIAANIYGLAYNVTSGRLNVNGICNNSGNYDVTDGGGNTIRFAVAADGTLTVVRTAGSATWTVVVLVIWL